MTLVSKAPGQFTQLLPPKSEAVDLSAPRSSAISRRPRQESKNGRWYSKHYHPLVFKSKSGRETVHDPSVACRSVASCQQSKFGQRGPSVSQRDPSVNEHSFQITSEIWFSHRLQYRCAYAHMATFMALTLSSGLSLRVRLIPFVKSNPKSFA